MSPPPGRPKAGSLPPGGTARGAKGVPLDPPPGRPTAGRRLLRIGAWAVAVILLLLVGLMFIASRPSTLQWAAAQASALTGGKLTIEGASGSILRGVSAQSVRWEDGGIAVTASSLRFSYYPFDLLDGRVRIERISIASLEIALPSAQQDGKPQPAVKLPPAMAALLPVAIERIDIGRVELLRAGSELAVIQDIEAVFRHDGDRLHANLLNADASIGQTTIGVRGEASAFARAPYATDGRFAVQVPLRPLPSGTSGSGLQSSRPPPPASLSSGSQPSSLQSLGYRLLSAQPLRLDVRVNGPLEEVSVRATTAFAGASLEARTVVHAMDPRPLRQLRMELKDLDLSRLDRALPATRVAGTFDAEVLPAWASGRKPLLIGPLNLTNALPGAIDRDRIPIATAKAVVGYVDGRIEFQDLRAGGPIGDVTGDGWLESDTFSFALASEAVRLQSIAAGFAPRTMNAQLMIEPTAKIGAAASPGGLDLSLELNDTRLAARIIARLAEQQLRISQAQILLKDGSPTAGKPTAGKPRAGKPTAGKPTAKESDRPSSGRASFTGVVGIAAPWRVDLSGELRDFDPGRLLSAPTALLNGKWRVAGRMAGEQPHGEGGEFDAGITLTGSRFRNLPLGGSVAATLSLRDGQLHRLSAVDGNLAWGTSTLSASGALGEDADRLRLALVVPSVAEMRTGLAGVINAQATLRGPLRVPAIEAGIDGRRLAVNAGGRRTIRFERLSLVLDGSYAEHTADLEASSKDRRLVLAAKGGMSADAIWRGFVYELRASLPVLGIPASANDDASKATAKDGQDLELLQSFVLEAGPAHLVARNARFAYQGAVLDVGRFDWRDSRLAVRADASGIAARRLSDLLGASVPHAAPIRLEDLVLGASFEFRGDLADAGAADWLATLLLRREAGDVLLTGAEGEAPVAAGLHRLEASATIRDRVLAVVVNADGAQLGWISGQAQASLQGRSEPVWTRSALAGSPLTGRLELAAPSFRWIAPAANGRWRVDGALSARLDLSGTIMAPTAEGVITGSGLSARERKPGMRLRDGVLAADLSGNRIDVRLLRFESAGGSVAFSGQLQASGSRSGEAAVVMDRLPLPLEAQQQVVLSGTTIVSRRAQNLSVAGKLIVDQGVIRLGADESSAQLPGVPISADLEIDLGRRLVASGSGLTTDLKGNVRLGGEFPAAPRATGTVDLVDGSYRVNGRKLDIERGRIIFDGALSDPALDIVAIRDDLKLEPGIAIGGTADAPAVRLTGKPGLTDAQAFARLAAGSDVQALPADGEWSALQAAAATVGKQLALRLQATYTQCLRSVWDIVELQSEITDRLSRTVRAAGTEAAGLFGATAMDGPLR